MSAENDASGGGGEQKGLSFRDKMLLNKNKKMKEESARSDARKACGEAQLALAKCASGRTVSIAWACREQRAGYFECLKQYHEKLNPKSSDPPAAAKS